MDDLKSVAPEPAEEHDQGAPPETAAVEPPAGPTAPPQPAKRSVLAWAKARGTDPLILRATAAHRRWEIDDNVVPTEVTAEDFDTAVHATVNDRL